MMKQHHRLRTPKLALTLALGTTILAGPELPAAQALEDRIESYLEPYLQTGNFSGSVLVGREGEVLFSRSYGHASLDGQVPNTPQTSFHLASVSRVITSIGIMLLEQQGRLSTDDPLSKHLPDWPRGDEITIHHLLTLSAGFPNINEMRGYGMWQRARQTPATLVEKFRHLPLEFEPGTRSVHSNSNYNVLALLIEEISGLSYGEFLEKEIFAPLGMSRSGHDGDSGKSEPHWAMGYAPVGLTDMAPVADIDWSVKSGNGSLYATTEDLYRLDQAIASESLLGKQALEKMFSEHFPSNGYGWFLGERFGSRELYINGQSPGFGAYWGRSPDRDVTVIVLGNVQNGVPDAAGRDLIALVLDEPYDPPIMVSERPDSALLDELVGTYAFGPNFYRANGTVSIRVQDGHLFNGLHWLMPTTRGELTFQHRRYWSILEFRRDDASRVVELWYDRFVGRRVDAANPAAGALWPNLR